MHPRGSIGSNCPAADNSEPEVQLWKSNSEPGDDCLAGHAASREPGEDCLAGHAASREPGVVGTNK